MSGFRVKKQEARFRVHHCHIFKCEAQVPPKMLMCPEHWAMVPRDLKTPVVVNFLDDQCKGKVRPTNEWLKAARAAINHVEFKCGPRTLQKEMRND